MKKRGERLMGNKVAEEKRKPWRLFFSPSQLRAILVGSLVLYFRKA